MAVGNDAMVAFERGYEDYDKGVNECPFKTNKQWIKSWHEGAEEAKLNKTAKNNIKKESIKIMTKQDIGTMVEKAIIKVLNEGIDTHYKDYPQADVIYELYVNGNKKDAFYKLKHEKWDAMDFKEIFELGGHGRSHGGEKDTLFLMFLEFAADITANMGV